MLSRLHVFPTIRRLVLSQRISYHFYSNAVKKEKGHGVVLHNDSPRTIRDFLTPSRVKLLDLTISPYLPTITNLSNTPVNAVNITTCLPFRLFPHIYVGIGYSGGWLRETFHSSIPLQTTGLDTGEIGVSWERISDWKGGGMHRESVKSGGE